LDEEWGQREKGVVWEFHIFKRRGEGKKRLNNNNFLLEEGKKKKRGRGGPSIIKGRELKKRGTGQKSEGKRSAL